MDIKFTPPPGFQRRLTALDLKGFTPLEQSQAPLKLPAIAMTLHRSRVILLAEDDENDVMLMKMAHARVRMANPLRVVTDGGKVIEYLDGQGEFADRTRAPLPCLLLLDLKMPKKNGFEVLSWIRSKPVLKRLTVVVFTSSQESRDINLAYDLGANSYAVKQGNLDGLIDVLKRLEGWWVGVNKIPILGE